MISSSLVIIFPGQATQEEQTISFSFSFSTPTIITDGSFTHVSLDEAPSFTIQQGRPQMPQVTQTYELPWGSTITDVSIQLSSVDSLSIAEHVQPVPTYTSTGVQIVQDASIMDDTIYSNDEWYPSSWCTYTTGAGMNADGEHVLFVTFHVYPVCYKPSSKILETLDEISIEFTYKQGYQQMRPLTSGIDLLIITPNEFTQSLQQLVDHKQSFGLSTVVAELDDIYQIYSGRDKPEQIKTFIYDMVLNENAKNVLLIGDIKKLPIRHTDAYPWGDDFGGDILSDLYYADIFNESFAFCDWDANQNDVFGELAFSDGFPPWSNNTDGVDLYPDVHIGRLPVSSINELEVQIQKIMWYENVADFQNWFQRIILVGGDTFCLGQGSMPFVYEGEITNTKVAQQLPEFEKTFLWSSKRNLNPLTFNSEITKGAGFLSYAGHGFEHGWGTYRPNWPSPTMGLLQHVYYTPFLKGIQNEFKLPIIFFDACLTAKLDFNVSDLQRYYPRFTPLLVRLGLVPDDPNEYLDCFAWALLNKDDGGAIATIGATRPAYTMVDPNGVYGGAGYFDVRFFKAYEEGVSVSDMMHQAQLDYLNNVGLDYFTLEEFMLLGDPTLRVGGYPDGYSFF